MSDEVLRRPAYEMSLRAGLAEAATMLAAEAAVEQRTIERPFNGQPMRAHPGMTGAQVVVHWYYDLGCRRETRWRADRDDLRARLTAAEAALAAARAEGEAGRAGPRARGAGPSPHPPATPRR